MNETLQGDLKIGGSLESEVRKWDMNYVHGATFSMTTGPACAEAPWG